MNSDLAGTSTKRVRIATLPPGIHIEVLRVTLSPYGKVLEIHAETLSRAYKYPVANSVQVSMLMARHLPPHFSIVGKRVLVSYEGQTATRYCCGEVDHLYQVSHSPENGYRDTEPHKGHVCVHC